MVFTNDMLYLCGICGYFDTKAERKKVRVGLTI